MKQITVEFKELKPRDWQFVITKDNIRAIGHGHPDYESAKRSAEEILKILKNSHKIIYLS